jgi:hypothetical protein
MTDKVKDESKKSVERLTKASMSETTGPAMTLLDRKEVQTIKSEMTEEMMVLLLHILREKMRKDFVMSLKSRSEVEGSMK